jgi:hypothetical protein
MSIVKQAHTTYCPVLRTFSIPFQATKPVQPPPAHVLSVSLVAFEVVLTSPLPSVKVKPCRLQGFFHHARKSDKKAAVPDYTSLLKHAINITCRLWTRCA